MSARFTSARLVAVIAAAVLLGLAAARILHVQRAGARPTAPSATIPLPVQVATIERRNIPVVLEGLGTVEAYNTVTVRPLIQGQIADIDFIEGQKVQRGQVLAHLDDRLLAAALAQARAARKRDEAKLAYARSELGRLTAIAAQGYVSRQLVDSQRAQVAVLAATVAADQAAVANAAVQLSYTTIRAPIAGITGIRLVDKGNVISPSGPGIVVITQAQPITVVFSLPADEVARLPLGQAAGPLPVAAFERDDRHRLACGTLMLLDNRVDPSTNTVRLKAVFANRAGRLRPGEFVNAHLRAAIRRGVLVVPQAAVQHGDQGPFVWLLHPGPVVVRQAVALGREDGRQVEVERGLAPGERIAIQGADRLYSGEAVAVSNRASAASSPAAVALEVP